MLLLGAGESGKSTFVKQMKIIHQQGYTADEIENFVQVIYSNLLQSIKSMVGAVDRFHLQFASDQVREISERLNSIPAAQGITIEHKDMVQKVWADPAIQAVFLRSSEYWLPDSTDYYFHDLERIFSPNFTPSEQDILRCRVRTTGVTETTFQYRQLKFRLVDVGGQRNERKKWIHCFEDVTAVLFVVAISEYDQKLFEDDGENRMAESIALFDEICNSPWFADTSMILFLNKTDLFKEKFCVKKVPLTIAFPNYSAGDSYDAATAFIQAHFEALNKQETKKIYSHLTCATDTENIKVVFDAVKEIILSKTLRMSGFLAPHS